jgi:hypothetical protein
MIRVVILDPAPDFLPIPDPGVKQGSNRHRIPDQDPQHCFQHSLCEEQSLRTLAPPASGETTMASSL